MGTLYNIFFEVEACAILDVSYDCFDAPRRKRSAVKLSEAGESDAIVVLSYWEAFVAVEITSSGELQEYISLFYLNC